MSYRERTGCISNEDTRHHLAVPPVAQAHIAQRDRRSVRTHDLAPVTWSRQTGIAVAIGVTTDTIIIQRGEDHRRTSLTVYGEGTFHCNPVASSGLDYNARFNDQGCTTAHCHPTGNEVRITG